MRRVGVVLIGLVASALVSIPATATPARATNARPTSAPADAAGAPAQAAAGFAHLPLRFEANQGQADPAARFVVRSGGGVAYLTAHDAVLTMPRRPEEPDAAPAGTDTLRLTPAGADPGATVSGVDRLPGASNYLIGNDPAAWHTGVAAYARVRYAGVYPGVDVVWHGEGGRLASPPTPGSATPACTRAWTLVWHGEGGRLEYDFEVAPGADPTPSPSPSTATSGAAGTTRWAGWPSTPPTAPTPPAGRLR